ncbi:HTH_Tnp_Tc3_2 domain-containing protein [Trichonephila clavipes]|uniref:HTH_Tnp_Tc3_2 domain-containing protein n=1 Tax=Trichonephila clavipes TaxID=2585209 RepID=A0A8X6VB28_TRICX|nr:HTH_Tnp_Tc3_2 domain-containing protein [Trichonephila clavipes]
MRWRIIRRLEAGQCQVQICREFNLTLSVVVCNLWKQFQDTKRKPGQGRPRATMAREDPHLSIIERRNRGATASQLSRYLYAATGTRISRMTDSKRLQKRGLLNTDSRRTFIWREPVTRYLLSNVHEIDNYGGGGLMVWTGIMLDGRAPLHV